MSEEELKLKQELLLDIKEKLEKLNNEILSSRTLTCYEVSQRTKETIKIINKAIGGKDGQ